MQFIANAILFIVFAYFAISAIGIWWILGAGVLWILAEIAKGK